MFFEMFSVFITRPYLAFLIAFAFGGCYWYWRRRTMLVTAVLWLLYGVMETLNYLRITCSGECNIRIDLLAIYPILGTLSLAGLVSVVSALRAGGSRTP